MDNFEFAIEFNKRARKEIKFERINPFVHSYTFPFHDLLKLYKDHFIEEWKGHQLPNHDNNIVANFPSDEKVDILHKLLIPHIMGIVNQYYIIEGSKTSENFGMYVQNGEYNVEAFHNHIFSPNSVAMIATFYIDPPSTNEGGGLDFMFHQNLIENVKVEKDKIYFFPNWLLHSPSPQKSNNFRICFNYSIYSIKKPLNKISGDIW